MVRDEGAAGSDRATAAAAERARSERARPERHRVIGNNKVWRAETFRRAWLAALLARTTPAQGALRFILAELGCGHWMICPSPSQGLDGGRAIGTARSAQPCPPAAAPFLQLRWEAAAPARSGER